MDNSYQTVASDSAAQGTILRKLQEGALQEIFVDPSKMLDRIMDALGAEAPVLQETLCGTEGVKVSIKLEFSIGEQRMFSQFEGRPALRKETAVKDAVVLALKHLDQDCQLKVIDYSARVALKLASYNTFALLKEASVVVQSILESFSKVLQKCNELGSNFLNNESEQTSINTDASRFLQAIVRRASMKTHEARTMLCSIENRLGDHERSYATKARQNALKGYSKTVVLSAKSLLDYVMDLFGFEKPAYTHVSGDDTQIVEGFAIFQLPYIDLLKCGGNMHVKGTGESTLAAEDDAAFHSLMLIEENYKLKIVDLSHDNRLTSEKVNSDLVNMVDLLLGVGESVKESWNDLIDELVEYRDHLSYSKVSLIIGGLKLDEIPFYELCVQSLEVLEEESAKLGYRICSDMFSNMQEITCKLDSIKIKLGII